jgi:hypothetical protein
MKKSIFIFLFFVFSIQFLNAEIELYFEQESRDIPKQIISLEIGTGSFSRTYTQMVNKETKIDNKQQYFGGFKIGAEDIGLRLFLSGRYLNIEDVNTYSYGFELDSFFNKSSETFRAFYGINFGLIDYKLNKIESENDPDFERVTTPYYGIQLGAVYSFNANFETEFGTRYALTNFNSNEFDTSYIIDEIWTVYFSINYKYNFED